MEILIVALIIGLVPASIASSKGRSFLAWWVYGAALFIIALPHSILMRSNSRAIEARAMRDGMKKCEHCAEMIKAEAKLCRFCHQPV